jgi:hypothetical protein
MALKTIILPSAPKTEPAIGLETVWLASACSQPAKRTPSAANAMGKAEQCRALAPANGFS